MKSLRYRCTWCCITLLVLATLGCRQQSPEAAAILPADGIESLPPQQLQLALSQLTASDARQQLSGLRFAHEFPSLALSHRELIERLSERGANAKVKQQARDLLAQSPTTH